MRLLRLISPRGLASNEIFKRFVISVSVFAFGAMMVLLAESNIEPSIKQEVVALIGVILASLGGAYAFIHYLALLFSRLRGK